MMKFDDRLHKEVEEHPYPLLFATVSGAHLYGFPSADSDWDLRGVHRLPFDELMGLGIPRETVETSYLKDGFEMDLVTHDVRKFMHMMLKPNGYVLEQLLSPLVVYTTPEHQRMVEIAPQCFTSNHAKHYLGFANGQWDLFTKKMRVKPLLYTYRVLLTGIHLMRSGELQANLLALNTIYKLPQLSDLIALKTEGCEKEPIDSGNVDFHRSEFERLAAELQSARDASSLPAESNARKPLEELLIHIRRMDL